MFILLCCSFLSAFSFKGRKRVAETDEGERGRNKPTLIKRTESKEKRSAEDVDPPVVYTIGVHGRMKADGYNWTDGVTVKPKVQRGHSHPHINVLKGNSGVNLIHG